MLFAPARPFLHRLEAERAHRLTLWALRHGLGGYERTADDPILRTDLWGIAFPNPLGLAAGFDKDAEVPDAMLRLGFGFVEVGTVTPRPQPGNPRPRVFRLTEDGAIINRLGFNSGGLAGLCERLLERPHDGIVGVNIGRNRDSADAIADYVTGFRAVAAFAHYVVLNLSSPNTPGLRALQSRAALGELLDAVAGRCTGLPRSGPPLLIKIAPDLEPAECEAIAAVAVEHDVSGIIVSNTTIGHRAGLLSRFRDEAGGLSGRPLFAPSTALLGAMYRLLGGRVPLIGVGGIASGDDAYAKIRAGAALVQLYTALVYQGPALIGKVKAGLAARLRADGFATVAAAVGAGPIAGR
ncbi:MAG: quinone-dependent dihydroorotate dehydrogenase [Alphaproteobacteria bacterium]|nr:quinone-dependent dihydroorotate dehydrogenase [Alphaproteobacteria bacterium]